jgi:hypothetical protein
MQGFEFKKQEKNTGIPKKIKKFVLITPTIKEEQYCVKNHLCVTPFTDAK